MKIPTVYQKLYDAVKQNIKISQYNKKLCDSNCVYKSCFTEWCDLFDTDLDDGISVYIVTGRCKKCLEIFKDK